MAEIQPFRPEFTNLVQVFESSVERFADRPLFGVLRGDDVQWTSYREFSALVDKMRSGLHKLGVRAGDAVAVISNNRLEWAVGQHAAIGLGARYVPMYEAQASEDWQFILDDADVSVCFVANDAVAQRLAPLRAALPKLREVVNFEGPAEDPTSYAGLLAYGATHPVPTITPKESDLAILIYTSGTTGKPKGVMLTHHNVASNVSSLLATVTVNQEDVGLAFLPWAHVFGGSIELNLTLVTGSATVICSDASQLSAYLPKVKPTILFAVPRVWNKIYDSVNKLFAAHPVFQGALKARAKQRKGEAPEPAELEALDAAEKNLFPLVRGAFGGRLRYACSGAAALSREVAEFMDTIGIEVYEGYGMTETAGAIVALVGGGGCRLGVETIGPESDASSSVAARFSSSALRPAPASAAASTALFSQTIAS